jgi:hypothetical protein
MISNLADCLSIFFYPNDFAICLNPPVFLHQGDSANSLGFFFLHSFEVLLVRGLSLHLSFQIDGSPAYADVQIKAKELRARIIFLFNICITPMIPIG